MKQLSSANKFIAQKALDFKNQILPKTEKNQKDNSLDREDSGSNDEDNIFSTDRPVRLKATPRGLASSIVREVNKNNMSLFLLDKL